MACIDTEKLKRNIRVNLMPNVDIDGTVTVENAERYFLNLIDKTSTADVVEVVRCKDCKHKEQCCEFIMISGKDKNIDFCSYGERRDT